MAVGVEEGVEHPFNQDESVVLGGFSGEEFVEGAFGFDDLQTFRAGFHRNEHNLALGHAFEDPVFELQKILQHLGGRFLFPQIVATIEDNQDGWLIAQDGFFKVMVAILDTPLLYICVWLFRKKFNLKAGEEIKLN